MSALTFDFFLSWTPVLLIMALAVGLKRGALDLALWGTAYTVLLVLFWFRTPPAVIALSAVDGVLSNLPLLLVIYSGMLLSGLLLETGSLVRVVSWFSGLTKNDWHRTLLISVGSGNFMEGAGIVAEPVIAPMLHASGLPPTGAAALSIVGYSGLMVLELGGAILSVLGIVTGLDPARLSRDVAALSLPATLLLVLSIPWLLGRTDQLKMQLTLLAGVALTAGGGALLAVHHVGAPVSGLCGGIAVLLGLMAAGTRRWNVSAELLRDMAPLSFLVLCLFSLNFIGPLRKAAVGAWPGMVQVIPGHKIFFQPLFSAYTYIFLAYLLALVLLRNHTNVVRNLVATNRRAWKPVLAMALFGVAGQIIAYSGYEVGFASVNTSMNIPSTLAGGVVAVSGRFYPVFAPLVGWAGTFLTGYGTASIVLFGKLHVTTAKLIGVSPSLLASGLAVGSAIGSVSSPLKVALAAPMCGAQGREGEILRRTIPLGLAVALALGIVLLIVTG